jgi:hypothetical protein
MKYRFKRNMLALFKHEKVFFSLQVTGNPYKLKIKSRWK